jgi:hypothetical protein
MPESQAPEELFAQARLRDYKARRSSSWDRSGGNGDAVAVDPGKQATLLDVQGAGMVTHLWFTINSPDPMHLKNLVLRAWWDGESSPSIETPIGDFFGLGLGEYYTYQSELLAVAPMKAMNAYFKMPFATSARLTLTNEGSGRTTFTSPWIMSPLQVFRATSAASTRNIGRPHRAKAGPTTGPTNTHPTSTTRRT